MSSGGLGMPNVEGISTRALARMLCELLVGFGRLRPLDVACEIRPGQSGLQRLAGLALGLAKVKSRGQAICSAGILFEVGLEMVDRPGEVPANWLVRPIEKRSWARRTWGSWQRSRAWNSSSHAALGSGWITGSSGSSSRRAKA